MPITYMLEGFGLFLKGQSRYAEAEALHERALGIRFDWLDMPNVLVSNSRYNLVLTVEQQRRRMRKPRIFFGILWKSDWSF